MFFGDLGGVGVEGGVGVLLEGIVGDDEFFCWGGVFDGGGGVVNG